MATGMQLLIERHVRMISHESRETGLAMTVRPSDIFVATYPKSGTTWMQQIVHGLRTGGSMEFEEISEVVPWTIVAHDCGQDINAEQVASPRCFKSHESYDLIPKGGKYIYITRNPKQVLLSFYPFLLSWTQVDPSTVTLEEFYSALFVGHGSNSGKIGHHMLSWWPHRHDDNVLWLCYEDLIEDLNSCIRKVAEFMEIDCDDELVQLIAHQSSFEFMKAHSDQFDDHWTFNRLKGQMGIDGEATGWVGKVHKKDSASGLTPELDALLNEKWAEVFASATGISSYEKMRAEISVLRR